MVKNNVFRLSPLTVLSMEEPKKILAILFKYLGDVAIAVPSLRAIKERFPNCELHMTVAEEAAPLLHGLPYLTKVWAFPRARDNAQIRKSWPIVRALRRQKFDWSVDFVGNDRGALVSLMAGAKLRLAPIVEGGFVGRHLCYNQGIQETHALQHEVFRDLHVVSHWGVPQPSRTNLELHADPKWKEFAEQALPGGAVVAHITTSQQKKEWPVRHWIQLFRHCLLANYPIYFSAGPSPREQALLLELKAASRKVKILPPMPDLAAYLAVLNRARVLVTGDTGPLHFAIGLGVPTISLFGSSSVEQWGPIWKEHKVIYADGCVCPSTASVCTSNAHCIGKITPELVFRYLKAELESQAIPTPASR